MSYVFMYSALAGGKKWEKNKAKWIGRRICVIFNDR